MRAGADQGLGPGSIQHPYSSDILLGRRQLLFPLKVCVRVFASASASGRRCPDSRQLQRDTRPGGTFGVAGQSRLHPPCAFCKHTRSAETNGCWRSLSPPARSRCRSRPPSANPWDFFLSGLHDRDFANWSRPLLCGTARGENRVARRQIARGWSFIDLARKFRYREEGKWDKLELRVAIC